MQRYSSPYLSEHQSIKTGGKRMKWTHWTILILLCFGIFGFSYAEKVTGKTVVLQNKVIEQLEYDGSSGKTRINILPISVTKQTKSLELEGVWHCLGYITSRKSF